MMLEILNNLRVWMVRRRMPARWINRVSATYSEAMEKNTEKLQRRQPDSFGAESSLHGEG